jgi:hypothetical protein
MLIISFGVSNAGQTVKQFDINQSFLKTTYPSTNLVKASEISHLDSYNDFETPLQIEQGIPEKFYLRLSDYDGNPNFENTYAGLKIITSNNNLKDDINITGEHDNSEYALCKFNFKDMIFLDSQESSSFKYLLCPITLTASPHPDLIGNVSPHHISYFPQNGNTVDFANKTKQINVIPHDESGIIQVVAADGKPNTISALSVSNTSENDNIEIKFEVLGATKTTDAYLKFKSTDEKIAKLSKTTCDIKVDEITSKGSCKVTLTPIRNGNATIDLSDSTYLRNDGKTLKYQKLPAVHVNIGSLYAGYMNGKVYRKGTTQMLEGGSSVRALAINSKDDILYAINSTKVYAQQNPMLNLSLKSIVSIGDERNTLQTLSLTNNVNELLVGNGNGAFKVTGDISKQLANNNNTLKSIVSSYIDQETNIVYFADNNNNLGVYKNESLTKYKLPGLAGKNNLVAANSGAVYISSSHNLPFGNNMNSAILYKFITENNDSVGKLVEIKTSNKPFESTSIKKLFFADMDENRVNLYAASNTGKLYRLDTIANPPKWELKADINTTGSIQDVVVDNLRNIYIAVDGKVLRIKNHESTAIELPDYTDKNTKPASLVVDNNDGIQLLETIKINKSDEVYTGRPYWYLHDYTMVSGIQINTISTHIYFVVAPWMNAESENNPLSRGIWMQEFKDSKEQSFIVKVTNTKTKTTYNLIVDGFHTNLCWGNYYAMNSSNNCQGNTQLSTKINSEKNKSIPDGHYVGSTDILVKGWDWTNLANENSANIGKLTVEVDWTKN